MKENISVANKAYAKPIPPFILHRSNDEEIIKINVQKVAVFKIDLRSLTNINTRFLKLSIARNGINDINDKIFEE